MRTVIAGDFHGRDMNPFIDRVIALKPDNYISLGDFDTVDCILGEIKLESILKDSGCNVYSVIGNHDLSIYKDHYIESSSISKDETSVDKLHYQLMNDSTAKKYIEELLKNYYISIDNFLGYKTIIVHGGLSGNLTSFPDAPIDEQCLWFRIEENSDYIKNNNEMIKQGVNLMIRGHDHFPELSFVKEGIVTYTTGWSTRVQNFKDTPAQVLQPGSADLNWFAMIEDGVVNFLNVD